MHVVLLESMSLWL